MYFTSSALYALPYYAIRSDPCTLICLSLPGSLSSQSFPIAKNSKRCKRKSVPCRRTSQWSEFHDGPPSSPWLSSTNLTSVFCPSCHFIDDCVRATTSLRRQTGLQWWVINFLTMTKLFLVKKLKYSYLSFGDYFNFLFPSA
jgi:hypothetical protein